VDCFGFSAFARFLVFLSIWEAFLVAKGVPLISITGRALQKSKRPDRGTKMPAKRGGGGTAPKRRHVAAESSLVAVGAAGDEASAKKRKQPPGGMC
jgi:hypothetical protein